MTADKLLSKCTIRDLSSADATPYDLLLEADPWKEQVDKYLSDGHCRVALIDSLCVGVYVLKMSQQSTEIMNIAVASDLRGKGLGKMLLQDAVDQCRLRDLKTLWVGTGNSSFAELAFYQKCGFRIVAVELDYFADYPEKIMENGIWCRDLIKMSMSV